jgi:hypothetical protein
MTHHVPDICCEQESASDRSCGAVTLADMEFGRRFMRVIGVAAMSLAVLASSPAVDAQAGSGGMRGAADAIAAARRLLQQVGGDAWRARVMEVTERAYLLNGEQVELRITRDFESGRRLLERRGPSGRFVEWIAGDRGWTQQDGKRQTMAEQERIAAFQGLKQEPYAIYHRLAAADASLRAELRDHDTRLLMYDADDRVLCWFRIDGSGRPIGWGNFYDGQINEHYYGPVAPFGSINLPRWGVSSTGAFRFEYLAARLSDQPLQEPHP